MSTRSFELSDSEEERFQAWVKEQDAIVAERQLKEMGEEAYNQLAYKPYYGAIGGVITWKVSYTSIGEFVTAVHEVTQAKFEVDGNW